MTAAIPVLEILVSTQAGGGPQHVLALATGLGGRNWRPIVAGPRGGVLFERFAAAGAERIAARTDRLRPRTLQTLIHEIRRRGVRLVHSHGKGAGVYGRLAARIVGVPAIHTFHGIHFERYRAPVAAAYLALERRLSRWTAVVINVSHAQEAEGLALGLFRRGQSRVIVNGVDVARLDADALARDEARAALGVPDKIAVVGCAARFDEVKRLDVLLRALAAVGDTSAVAVLIGAGAQEGRLRGIAGSLGLGPRAVFAGEIPEAARLFRAFDVYAAPSRKEGMPLAVLEAMALGLPVIASDIPAHREVLGPAGEALAGSEEAFGAALGRLVRDPERARSLGAANRTRARSEFDARQMVAAVDHVYRGVLGL